MCGALATRFASASKIAQEKSSRSLMLTELAVWRSTAPICSATCMNSALKTSSRIGSATHPSIDAPRSLRTSCTVARTSRPPSRPRFRASPVRSSWSRRPRTGAADRCTASPARRSPRKRTGTSCTTPSIQTVAERARVASPPNGYRRTAGRAGAGVDALDGFGHHCGDHEPGPPSSAKPYSCRCAAKKASRSVPRPGPWQFDRGVGSGEPQVGTALQVDGVPPTPLSLQLVRRFLLQARPAPASPAACPAASSARSTVRRRIARRLVRPMP